MTEDRWFVGVAGGPERGGSSSHPATAVWEDPADRRLVVRQRRHDPLVTGHPAQQEGVVFELRPDTGISEHVEEVASAIELLAYVVAELGAAEAASACLPGPIRSPRASRPSSHEAAARQSRGELHAAHSAREPV